MHGKKIIIVLILSILIISALMLVGIISYTVHSPQRVADFVAKLVPSPTPITVRLKGVGIIGDSTSDEYRGDDNRGLTYAPTTLNWVEILQKYRRLNFGSWGMWSEPRRTGYEYNWSRTGATVNSMIVSGQHIGVAKQVHDRKVNLVIITIGANDYAPYITPDGYDGMYNGMVTDEQILRKKNRLLADMTTAIDTIRANGNVPVLLMKIPDWGNSFAIRLAFPIPQQRQRVTDAVIAVNNDLEQMAKTRGMRTLDPNRFYQKEFVTKEENITIAGVKMNAFLPSDDPHSIFLEDGVHLGTLANGLYANFIIDALKQEYAIPVRTFSGDELKDIAGL
jgi:lysophospholipase L1-like esterase